MRQIIFCLCLVLPVLASAQINISAQLPPAGMVQKDQLWNLVIVNNKDDILTVNVKLNVQDAITGELVMSANTGSMLLNKGVKLVSKNDIQPVLYNYNRNEFSKTFLPMGSYVACYQLYYTSQKGEEVLGDECIKINIDPLSPPILTSPADKSDIITPYPQFSWVPPTPFDMFSNLNYEIVLTEVLEGQSPAEAIQQNTPVYTRTSLTQPYESYPSSFTTLQPKTTYAWQVIARNETDYAVKTEIWTFKVKKPEIPLDIVAMTPFVQMKTNNYVTAVAPNGILKIAYINKTTEKEVSVQVFDLSDVSSDRKPASFKANLIQGVNNIQYDLKKLFQVNETHEYLAQIVNANHETWFVKFSVKKYK